MKVLKFGAVWCPGCLVMRPRWAEIEKDNPWLKNEYYDFDQDKDMVDRYNINSTLPAFIFLDDYGKEFMRLTGEISKDKLLQIIEQNKEK